MKQKTQRRIIRAVIVLVIVIATSIWVHESGKEVLNGISITDTEADVIAIEQLLKLAQTHPIGAFPQEDLHPSIQNAFVQNSMKDGSECWNSIQDAVAKNGNSYEISATDPFRQYGRDVDNSVVEARFQDGRVIAFTFYQQTMVGCNIELLTTE